MCLSSILWIRGQFQLDSSDDIAEFLARKCFYIEVTLKKHLSYKYFQRIVFTNNIMCEVFKVFQRLLLQFVLNALFL